MPRTRSATWRSLDIDVARILHGEQAFTYHAPVSEGDVLTFRPTLASVTDKKGGALTFVVIETGVTNQRGAHVADLSRTIVVRNEGTRHESARRRRARRA